MEQEIKLDYNKLHYVTLSDGEGFTDRKMVVADDVLAAKAVYEKFKSLKKNERYSTIENSNAKIYYNSNDIPELGEYKMFSITSGSVVMIFIAETMEIAADYWIKYNIDSGMLNTSLSDIKKIVPHIDKVIIDKVVIDEVIPKSSFRRKISLGNT